MVRGGFYWGHHVSLLTEDTARKYRWYQLEPDLVNLAKNIQAAINKARVTQDAGWNNTLDTIFVEVYDEAYTMTEEEASREKANLKKHKGNLYNK